MSVAHKAVILGNSGVGKTALVQVRELGELGDQYSTIQPSEVKYTENINGKDITVAIWDTPGQYTFRNLVKNFLRDTECLVFVFDITCEQSFDELEDWFRFTQDTVQCENLVLVGNKTDLESERKVAPERALAWANKHKAQFIQTSAVAKTGVKDLFLEIARMFENYEDANKPKLVALDDDADKKKNGGGGGCC